MGIDGRIESLRRQHKELDDQIDALAISGVADDLQMQRLKRTRLEIKDELSRLQG